MNYKLNFPDGFTGKDEPEEYEYKALVEIETTVMAYSKEDAIEQIKELFREEFDSYYINIE